MRCTRPRASGNTRARPAATRGATLRRARISCLTFGAVMAGVLWGAPVAGAATFVVMNANDSGSGSLRQAILDSNAVPPGSPNVITFSIGSGGPATIFPISALPPITRSVAIQGDSQPPGAGSPLITLDGIGAPGATGLDAAAQVGIVDVSVVRFAGAGIQLDPGSANSNVVRSYIGITPQGNAAGNGRGIVVNAPQVVIGQNASTPDVISGNGDAGIVILNGANNTLVQGNLIGTDPSGTIAIGNGFDGVVVAGSSNTIGGLVASQRNIISGNRRFGVNLIAPATQNLVAGNFIGTDVSGTAPIGNGVAGVRLDGVRGNQIGLPGTPQQIWFNPVQISSSLNGNFYPSNSLYVMPGALFQYGNPGIVIADFTASGLFSTPDRRNFNFAVSRLTPNQPFFIELFTNPPGTCQAKTYLRTLSGQSDAAGSGNATTVLAQPLPPGDVPSFTVTDSLTGTSPILGCPTAQGQPPPNPGPLGPSIPLHPPFSFARPQVVAGAVRADGSFGTVTVECPSFSSIPDALLTPDERVFRPTPCSASFEIDCGLHSGLAISSGASVCNERIKDLSAATGRARAHMARARLKREPNLGMATTQIPAGQRKVVTLRLSPGGLKTLKRVHKLPVSIVVGVSKGASRIEFVGSARLTAPRARRRGGRR